MLYGRTRPRSSDGAILDLHLTEAVSFPRDAKVRSSGQPRERQSSKLEVAGSTPAGVPFRESPLRDPKAGFTILEWVAFTALRVRFPLCSQVLFLLSLSNAGRKSPTSQSAWTVAIRKRLQNYRSETLRFLQLTPHRVRDNFAPKKVAHFLFDAQIFGSAKLYGVLISKKSSLIRILVFQNY